MLRVSRVLSHVNSRTSSSLPVARTTRSAGPCTSSTRRTANTSARGSAHSHLVLVVGAGAIGALFASRLQKVGARVAVVCRSNYDKVLRDGFRVKSVLFGKYVFRPTYVTNSVASAQQWVAKQRDDELGFDYVLVCTGAHPKTIRTSDIVREAVSPNTAIALIQNGINIEQDVSTAFPNNTVITAITHTGVSQTVAGEIEHHVEQRIGVGLYGAGDVTKLEALRDAFLAGGFHGYIPSHAQEMRWHKLLWNASWGPVSILAGQVNTKVLYENDGTRTLVRRLQEEIRETAEADLGRPMNFKEYPTIKQFMDFTGRLEYVPGMLRVFQNKGPVELDAVLGSVIEMAEKYGVKVPTLRAIYELLSVADQKNRGVFPA